VSIIETSLGRRPSTQPENWRYGFSLTSGILSKPFEIALMIGIRSTYETATFKVSAL
jgi:hypothetical protein